MSWWRHSRAQWLSFSLTVTPSTFSDVTRTIPWSGGGGCTRHLFRLSVNTISADLDWFSVRLLTSDHTAILLISRSRLSILQAGITRYVSSAYLTIMFPGVTACRSAALTTYMTGPIADPWIMLAFTSSRCNVWPLTKLILRSVKYLTYAILNHPQNFVRTVWVSKIRFSNTWPLILALTKIYQ